MSVAAIAVDVDSHVRIWSVKVLAAALWALHPGPRLRGEIGLIV